MIGSGFGLMLAAASTVTYATWNPLDKAASFTLSSGNNVVTMTPTVGQVRATIGKSSGKWYWECVVGVTVTGPILGIATAVASVDAYTGQETTSWSYYGFNGQKYSNAAGSAYGSTYAVGDVIGVALDMAGGTVTFYKNNVSQGIAFTGLTGTIYPAVAQSGANSPTVTGNFGASAWVYAPPAGYSGLSNAAATPPAYVGGSALIAAGTIDYPTGTIAGDLVIVITHSDVPTAPAGFTSAFITAAADYTYKKNVCYKTAGAETSFNYTGSGGGFDGTLVVLRGRTAISASHTFSSIGAGSSTNTNVAVAGTAILIASDRGSGLPTVSTGDGNFTGAAQYFAQATAVYVNYPASTIKTFTDANNSFSTSGLLIVVT